MSLLRASLLFCTSLWLAALAPSSIAFNTVAERASAIIDHDAHSGDPAIRPEAPQPHRATAPLSASLVTAICALLPPTVVGETAPDHVRLLDSPLRPSALGARAPPSFRA